LIKTLTLWDRRRVIDFADALLAFTLAQEKSRGARMSHNVATDGLLGVHRVGHATARIRRHLVRDKDGYIELLRYLLELAHDSVKNLLPLGELATTRVVDAEGRHDRVDDQQGKAVIYHAARSLAKQVNKAIDCERSPHHDVIKDTLRV